MNWSHNLPPGCSSRDIEERFGDSLEQPHAHPYVENMTKSTSLPKIEDGLEKRHEIARREADELWRLVDEFITMADAAEKRAEELNEQLNIEEE